MKSTLIILISLIGIAAFSSCKKDKTLDTDITDYEWELKSVTIDGNKDKRPNENFHHPKAYVLIFENDTMFWLHLSSNSSGGKYTIPTKGIVEIDTYSNLTEIAMTDFDNKLMSVFNEMTAYTVKGKTLTFKGNNNEVEFRKK